MGIVECQDKESLYDKLQRPVALHVFVFGTELTPNESSNHISLHTHLP
jgi:hypothetical protein